MMILRNIALAGSLSVLLTACSGGGSSSSTDGNNGASPETNAAPTVSNITISGSLTVGQTLTGQYNYSDAEGDTEGASTFRWLRNGTAISGATSNSLVLTAADVGQNILFAITPVASSGSLIGVEGLSSAASIPLANAAPMAANVSINGIPAVGQTLTGQYTFSDTNNDSEGTSTFRWLRNGTAISGATNNTYVLTTGDIGNEIVFAVTPVASMGVTTGTEVSSSAITSVASVLASKCNATTEASYVDTFINNAVADREWVNNQSGSTTQDFDVAYIAAQFNAARAGDLTIKEKLKMPSQAVWDAYSPSQKMLYLVNSERCARGLMPFEGIDPRMVGTAQSWADYLTANDVFTHGTGSNDIPSRFAAAGVNRNSGGNADFMTQSENLAVFISGNTAAEPEISETEARSVYGWMYDDKVATSGSYGHRTFILIKGLSSGNDYGSTDTEGLFGAATQTKSGTTVQNGNTFLTNTVNIVMHAFDPNANYMPNTGTSITPAPDYMPPLSQSDCASGTYQASTLTCM